MKKVFADTCYWIAILNPKDDLHLKAKQASEGLGPVFIVTSEMVLVELLNAFAERGDRFRGVATQMAEQIKSAPNCEVVPQTSIQFTKALERYKNRADKSWSLTDCASFLIMEEKNINEALTHDDHFLQAGFLALLRDNM
jgi:predicted nucleic acid-binding protein